MKYFIIVLSAVFLFFFIKSMDPALVLHHARQMGLGFLYIILISFVAYCLATLAWIYCYKNIPLLRRFGTFFVVRQIGETLSILNPTGIIGGDAVRSILIDDQRSSTETISSVTASRGLLWMSYILVCIIGTIISAIWIKGQPLAISIIIISFLVVIFYLLFKLFFGKMNWIETIRQVKFFQNSERAKKLYETIILIREEMKKLWMIRPLHISFAIVLFALHYLCGAYEFQYILQSLDIDIPFHSAIVLEVGTSLIRSIAVFVPGQIGIEEYSNKIFLQLVGVSSDEVWISVSVIRRIRQLFWILFALIAYAIFYHRKKSKSLKMSSL